MLGIQYFVMLFCKLFLPPNEGSLALTLNAAIAGCNMITIYFALYYVQLHLLKHSSHILRLLSQRCFFRGVPL